MSSLLRDAEQFGADFAAIGPYAGSTVRVRRYAGASGGGAAWSGRGETRQYQERPLTVQSLRVATTKDVEVSGGRIQTGDLIALLPAGAPPLTTQDRAVVNGQEYELSGQAQPEVLAGVRYQTAVLRRSGQ
jgi:hypothetical protein